MKRLFLTSLFAIQLALPSSGKASMAFFDSAGIGIEMAIDKTGNVYFTSVGTSLTVKYDKEGTKLWERDYQVATGHWGMCAAIALDSSGGAYITGHAMTRERAHDFDNTVFDYLTIKYDDRGRQVWLASYTEPNRILISPVDIAVDGHGDVYVLADSHELDRALDPNFVLDPNEELWRSPDSDFVTIKYDKNGKQLGVVRYGDEPNNQSTGASIALDPSGNVYVLGNSIVDKGLTKPIDLHFVTIKYDTSGKDAWVAKFAGEPNSLNSADTLAVDTLAHVYVAGSSRLSNADGYSDLVTVKYNKNGKQQWVARHRESANMCVFASAIAVDQAGTVCVTGNAGPTPTGKGFPPSDIIEKMKKNQILTVKYNAAGKQQWLAKYKGPEETGPFSRDLMTDALGNIYVIGSHALVVKYDPKGNEEWAKQFKDASQLAKFLGGLSR